MYAREFIAMTMLLAFLFACESQYEPDKCLELQMKVAECYPGTDVGFNCTDEILNHFDDISSLTCEDLKDPGKADWITFIGCSEEEYVCYFFFCCDIEVYPISWQATDEDFDIIDEITAFLQEIPADIQQRFESATKRELEYIITESYEQDIGAHTMQVEKTQGIIGVPLSTFFHVISPDQWGVRLADYMGGEVIVHKLDGDGNVVWQVERMVLSTVTSQLDCTDPLDMTKVENIVYDDNGATVFWKVMHSDNGSVIADVGSVDFRAYDQNSTLVTFHSAHKLSGGMPDFMVSEYLKMYFSEAISNYGKKVR